MHVASTAAAGLLAASLVGCTPARDHAAGKGPASESALRERERPTPSAEFLPFECAQGAAPGESSGARAPAEVLAAGFDHVQVVIAGPAHQIWAERGRPCGAASAVTECLRRYRKASEELAPAPRPCTDAHGCPSSACAITTRGDQVQAWCSASELQTLVGSVDDITEAFLLAHAQQGAALPLCGFAEASAYRKVANGYELRERRFTKTCRPLERSEIVYLVSSARAEQLSRKVLSSDAEACQSEDPDAVRSAKR